MAFTGLLFCVFSSIQIAVSSRVRDVPLGLCGDCEVNCFEDCVLKYDREIMQTDFLQAGKIQKHDSIKPTHDERLQAMQEKKKEAVNAEMQRLKSHKSKTCSKKQSCSLGDTCAKNMRNELQGLEEAARLNSQQEFEKIEEDELKKGEELEAKGRDWTQASGMDVTIADMPTWHAPSPAQLRMTTSLVSQNTSKGSLRGNLAPAPGMGPNEPRSYYPLHPVKIGSFSKGLINLDMCLQYCLATTCGCEGVPGMETSGQMDKVADVGAKAGTHVVTPPVWKYRKAKKEECGNGLGDNKVIKDLYVDFYPGVDGWIEICTKKFFDTTYGASAALGLTDATKDLEKCDCGVNRLDCHEPTYGCSWNHVKSRCEYKAMHNTVCFKRYTFDKGF